MQEFERALSRAMQRVEVRAETTQKFLALADEAEQKRLHHPSEQRTFAGDPGHAGGGLRLIRLSNGGRVLAMPRIPQAKAWMGGAIAAVLATGCFVGAHLHTEHERRVQAERQFEASQRITDETLARTREQLRAQGIYLDQ
jgi:hypothetical protein